jgi:hypothetical protein
VLNAARCFDTNLLHDLNPLRHGQHRVLQA